MRAPTCFLLLLVILFALNCARSGIASEPMFKEFDGSWKMIKWEAGGTDLLKLLEVRDPPVWCIAGNTISRENDGKDGLPESAITFTVSGNDKIRAIDLT